ACAMNCLKEGFQPIIIEAEDFPRFHIGESLTTECVDALNRLGLEKQLKELMPPRKKGVRIFSQHPENSFYVGAGDAWQVKRSAFDQMMLNEAVKRGAQHILARVDTIERKQNLWRLSIQTSEATKHLESRFVIDASGQQRFLQKQGLLGPIKSGDYAHQIAFFSQFEGVQHQDIDQHDTLIFHRKNHEWIWMIPLSDTRTSIGLVLPVEDFKKSDLSMDDFFESKLGSFSEPLNLRVKNIQHVGKTRAISNYSFSMDQYANNGLFCVGDSHRFIDPIFSFGVQFAVVEAEYAVKAILKCSQNEPETWQATHAQYMQITTQAQDVIQDMLSYFWAHPWGFANMAHQRYADEFLDIFAGRIYEKPAGEGLKRIRAAMTSPSDLPKD
ncbi:MAG: NAD(P)/FAD-dependent oxidoreductase, partial [Mariprofundaceae bacterium]|nr:NAD(P)/FAD-dependent oxidoreductase [Mariprofundaceae bacterium]